MHDFCIVIPARYKSSRFPGKPFADIAGTPMIVRTYQQCIKTVDSSKVFVATDNIKIKELCEKENINVVMTSESCLTGTDRVAEASQKIKSNVYINVQGDEPFLDPMDLEMFINIALKNPDIIHNAYCDIHDEDLFNNFNIPKLVLDKNERLIYMSRAPIPISKSGNFSKAYRQVCMYSFPKKMLDLFSSYKNKTDLEEIEDIEILRFIESGIPIQMIKVSENSIAVDTPNDLKKIHEMIGKGELT